MRQIKFRVWDENSNKFKVISEPNHFKYWQSGYGDDPKSNFPEMNQFTGLLDKNGKEIYEGDLYQVAKNAIYQVKYCEGGISDFEWYGGNVHFILNRRIVLPF